MNKTTTFTSQPLTKQNIKQFLAEEYKVTDAKTTSIKELNKFPFLLQRDYGQAMDCSITSMTACIHYFTKTDIQTIYNKVEDIAKKYFYNGDKYGTISVTIKAIYDAALLAFKFKRNTKYKVFKSLFGYNFNHIKDSIDKNVPVILSISHDGRDYYKNHTITVVGYEVFNNNYKFLIVADNWHKTPCYVDFKLLNEISSINY